MIFYRFGGCKSEFGKLKFIRAGDFFAWIAAGGIGNMQTSLRTRIISVVAGVVFLAMVSLLLTVQWQTRKFMVHEETEKALNLLHAMYFSVSNEYQSLQFFRTHYLDHTKIEIRDMVNAALTVVETEYQRYRSGNISLADAQKYCMTTLKKMRYDQNHGYFWINTGQPQNPTVVMHPFRPELEGCRLDVSEFNCVGSNHENLHQAMIRLCEQNGGGFLDYRWPLGDGQGTVRKIGYVIPFKPWNWIIGSSFHFEDIEKATDARLQAVIKELRHMVANFKVGDNGYFFIFTGQKKLLVHPSAGADGAETARNPDTGRLLFDEIVLDFKSGKKYSEYRWEKPFSEGKKLAAKRVYCEYFAPLDWYICVSYYMDDVEKPVASQTQRLMMLSLVLVFVALLASIILAGNLAAPLRRLAVAAETIDREGIDEMAIPITGSAETRELGLVLTRALSTIRTKENSLKASEENLRITLRSIGDAVVVTDIEGRITRMNLVAEKLLGWTFDEAKGHVLLDGVKLLNPFSSEPVDNPINQVLLDGNSHRLTVKTIILGHDGVKRLIDDSCAPIRSRDGQMVGVVMAFRDITEQTRIEETLHQSQKMDSLGQLAGGVAHDFNNMLAGIMACADLLRRKNSAIDDKIREYIDMIVSTCERAADLTSKLLAFSRKGKVISTPINLHQALRDAIVLLERSLDKRILIIQHLDAPHDIIIGDPAQIQNMIINLGINSGHAMPQGGTITITTREVELDEAFCHGSGFDIAAGSYIEVRFEDTGCGIPPDIINRIFEPFFTTRGQNQGTGLGLAAVYGSLKEHHGAVKVTSEVDVGTVFSIYLPLHEGTVLAVSATAENIPVGHGCLLLVDDEKIIRTACKSLLEDLGYEVLTAEDGQEGVDIYREQHDRINAVILDMIMPRMNGADCFYQIKKINPAAKVLMASGFSGSAIVATLKRDGLLGFLNKPYRSVELGRILREILQRR